MLVLKFLVFLFAEFLLIKNSVQDDGVTDPDTPTTREPTMDTWGGMCAKGSRQSPILLRRTEAQETTKPPFEFHDFENKLLGLELHNNGYGVELLVPSSHKIRISKGILDDEYFLTKVQWHWDRSEHDVDGRSARLETHLLFRNNKYHSWHDALSRGDGVVIMAVLHHLVPSSTNYISKISQVITQVKEVGGKASLIQDIAIGELLPSDTSTYYYYQGSLTSPPCLEVVTWVVFSDFLKITNGQIGDFRSVKAESGGQMNHNFRPLQSINNRKIYFNAFTQSAFRRARSTAPEKIRTSFGLISSAVAAVAVKII